MGTRTQIGFGYGFRIPESVYENMTDQQRDYLYDCAPDIYADDPEDANGPVVIFGMGMDDTTPYAIVTKSMTVWTDDPYHDEGFPKFINPTGNHILTWQAILRSFADKLGFKASGFGFLSILTYH